MQERIPVKKERESKEDGRYIIFYTFEDEDREDPEPPKKDDGD